MEGVEVQGLSGREGEEGKSKCRVWPIAQGGWKTGRKVMWLCKL